MNCSIEGTKHRDMFNTILDLCIDIPSFSFKHYAMNAYGGEDA
jgi:hypothetical protein